MLDGLFAFDDPCTGIQAVLPEEIILTSTVTSRTEVLEQDFWGK